MFSSHRWFGIQLGVVLLALVATAAGVNAQARDAEEELSAAWKRGQALREQRQYAEALPYYEQALKLAPRVYGPDHLQTGEIMNDLARLYRRMGQVAKAEPLFLRSLKIRETSLGKDHLDVALSCHNLALMYRLMSQYAKAERSPCAA